MPASTAAVPIAEGMLGVAGVSVLQPSVQQWQPHTTTAPNADMPLIRLVIKDRQFCGLSKILGPTRVLVPCLGFLLS